MINHLSSNRNRLINIVLTVAAVGLLAISVFFVYSAWRTGLEQSRAETATRLMAIRTSPRTTETPGINAWVSWSLLNNQTVDDSVNEGGLRQFVNPTDIARLPADLGSLLKTIQIPVPEEPADSQRISGSEFGLAGASSKLEFRDVNFIRSQDRVFILTARRDSPVQVGLKQFTDDASGHLAEVHSKWAAISDLGRLANLPNLGDARVARFYVLNEDESLLSLPIGSDEQGMGNELYLSEAEEFRKNPLSPSFVSNNFFFHFRYDEPLDEQAVFSGLYLDLGGLGLVASVMRPVIYRGKRAVLGADITFDLNWEDFASRLSPNLVSHVAHLDSTDNRIWNPWREFSLKVPDSKPGLKSELQELADQESADSVGGIRKSVYLANTSRGNVMAIQVDRSTWLLLNAGATEIRLPWATMLMTSIVFFCLFFRIETSRRQAVRAQKSARGEMQEKQNLLDTMQVPLMVVDPNTDEVVFCNRAAESIGMKRGTFFGRDIVASDPEAQAQYRRTQTLGEEHRRAYGVPIRVPTEINDQNSEFENRFAVVRSVTVTAPIESLGADERHRLGILFLVDEKVDLELLLRGKIEESKKEQKRLLSGLLNHGIDSLARVLNKRTKTPPESAELSRQVDPFATWLSGYLSERIQLLSWALENWGCDPYSLEMKIIEKGTVLATLKQYEQIFLIASRDRELREQLHWNNGVMSGARECDGLLDIKVDWDDDCCFSIPRDGLFGFFLNEALANAIRHGCSGSRIGCEMIQDRTRNELKFKITNLVDETNVRDSMAATRLEAKKPFGGLVIMNELARLSGWRSPIHQCESGDWSCEWSIPTIRKKAAGTAD